MFEKVKNFLNKRFNKEKLHITMDSDLVAITGINSLELVELICQFEEEFGVSIPDSDIRKFRYIRDIVKYLEEKTGLTSYKCGIKQA